MEDFEIIDLYFARNEHAIKETDRKYGKLCFSIAHNLLYSREDSEECVNDTYLSVWNAIPPNKPGHFMAFLCKITRNLSLKRLDYNLAKKRNPDLLVSLEELETVLPDNRVNPAMEDREIGEAISRFLRTETPQSRNVFLRKYWFFDSIQTICERYGFSESKVKSMLRRTRKRLKLYLKKEGIEL